MKNKRLLVASLMTCMLLSTPNLTAKAAYEPSSVMDLLIETTSPTDVSIQVGDKYYNLGPLDYDNAEAINPQKYAEGKYTTLYYKWDTYDDGSRGLVEATQSDSDLVINHINYGHNRQKANLNGGDLIGYTFNSQSSKSAYGGAIGNQAGYSIGNIASFFVNNKNYETKGHGGAIYNAGSILTITGDFIENFVDVTNGGFGGAISNLEGTIGTIDSNFIANYVDATGDVHGGAIHNNGEITSISGDFINNSSTSANSHSYGGAISNRKGGYIGEISGNFIGNYTYNTADVSTGESDNKDAMGGAISNIQKNTRINSISGGFVANYAESENNIAKGGAIFNSTNTASIGEIVGGFVGNYVKGDRGGYGGAIHNNTGNDTAAIESIDGLFKGNFATSASGDALGGAIYNANTSTSIAHLGDITGSFESNYVLGKTSAKGGAIYNAKGVIDSIEADFINNYAESTGSGAFGGAIYNNVDAEITSINGTFTGNHLTPKSNHAYGGAIYNAGTIDEITGYFESNHINTTVSAMGGAIANGLKTSSVTESGSIGLIEADFEGNGLSSKSDVHGGAIQNAASEITTISGDFIENFVGSTNNMAYGGAIANRKSGIIDSITGTFDDNHVYSHADYSANSNKNAHGGAIANYQDKSTISYIEGEFINNYALAEHNAAKGGAIYNATDSAAIGDIVADFINNGVDAAAGVYGGAIFNSTGTKTIARIGSITGDFERNHATIRDGAPNAAREAFGGAIYNANTTDTATNIAHIGDISGSFTENYVIGYVAHGGAIYNSKAIIDSIEASFTDNKASSDIDTFGGAIYNDNAKIGYIKGDFDGNSASLMPTTGGGGNGRYAGGGAIYNINGTIGDVVGDFSNNYVLAPRSYAQGGAIYNKNATIGAITGDFTNNYTIGSETSGGGAVYNENGDITFIDSSFKNNASTGGAGAIFNISPNEDYKSTVNIIANNKDVEFTGNKGNVTFSLNNNIYTPEGGQLYSIYNHASYLNLNAKNGKKITFNDKILGDNGIININKENAYLTLDSDLDEVIRDIDQIGGDYIFNSIVADNTINLYNNGIITLGSAGNLLLNGFTNDDNGGTLDAMNGTMQSMHLGSTDLTNSDLNFKMDLDVTDTSNIKSDTITVDGDSSVGNFVISDINLIGKVIADFTEDTEITRRVLYGNEDTTISLGTDVLNDFNKTVTLEGITGSDEWTGPDINWNDEFGGYTITRTIDSAISVIGSEQGLLDTLDWIVTVDDSDPVYTDKADNLALVNQYQTTETRHFNFDSANDEFVVSKDSGTTASGKLVINGVMDENGNRSTINGTDEQGNQHNLFELTSGTATEVEINDTKITGADTVATVSNGNTLTLINAEISGNTNGIINDGNLNLGGENIIADNISNATGGGVMNILSGSTNIANGANVNQNTLQIDSGSELNIAGTVSVADKFNNLGDVSIGDTGILNLNGNNLDITGRIVNENQLNINGSAENLGLIENNGEMTVNNDFTNIMPIMGTGTLTHKSGDFINNSSIDQNKFNNEGNVVNNDVITAPTVNNKGTITTDAENLISDIINNDGILNFTGGTTQGNISGSGTTNINGDLFIDSKITGNTVNLNSGMLAFTPDADLLGANVLNVNGGGIDVGDSKITSTKLGNVNLNNKADLVLDFNLTNLTSDTFDANVTNNGGIFHVSNINIIGSPVNIKDSIRIHLGDTTKLGRANITSDYYDLPDVMTPIRRLSGNLSNGWLNYGGTGNSFKDFNPSVMAGPVASLVGGFLTQSQVLQDGFYHMDRYTKYTQSQRMAAENTNKYADAAGTGVYTTSSLPETSSAMWVKPYTTFESVDLKNGTGVSNFAYGMLYGGDTDLVDLGRGYKGILSAFIGYNGSHQSYNGIDMNQQGGTLGVTGTLYKGNFFTGLTISTGASGGEAFTAYGTDKFSMLTAGIANKTGYNIEVAQGKLIIQPSLFLGYTFANTFDYTNAAGVKIKSDPLNAIQVAPGIKLIGNLENGWQPYLGVDMMWNIMGKTDFTANQTQLPNMSVKPYVQYGAGVQKSWGKRFTAFFQTMLRNGGRTGVVLQAGFRWTLGKEQKTDKISKTKKIIKE